VYFATPSRREVGPRQRESSLGCPVAGDPYKRRHHLCVNEIPKDPPIVREEDDVGPAEDRPERIDSDREKESEGYAE